MSLVEDGLSIIEFGDNRVDFPDFLVQLRRGDRFGFHVGIVTVAARKNCQHQDFDRWFLLFELFDDRLDASGNLFGGMRARVVRADHDDDGNTAHLLTCFFFFFFFCCHAATFSCGSQRTRHGARAAAAHCTHAAHRAVAPCSPRASAVLHCRLLFAVCAAYLFLLPRGVPAARARMRALPRARNSLLFFFFLLDLLFMVGVRSGGLFTFFFVDLVVEGV